MRRKLLPVLAAVSAVALMSACTLTWTADDGSSGQLNCPGAPTAVPTSAVSGTCTWSVTPKPTTAVPTTTGTVTPTTTTTVPPTTTPPPASGFPSPATTGAPAGQVFTTLAGGSSITTPNQVLNGVHVTGELLVKAPGVVIKNSWVEGYLDNEYAGLGSARMLVQDTTIGPSSGCNDSPGLGEHDYTAQRVRIVNHGDGFRASGSNITITDSFVQDCNSAQNHDDGLQVYCPAPDLPQPCQNLDVEHNTLSVALTGNFTAPLFGGEQSGTNNGQLANSKFLGNLLWGGVFTIYLYGSGLDIEHNRLATNAWKDPQDGNTYNGWVYGPSDVTCSGATWSDNHSVTINTGTWQVVSDTGSLDCA